MIQFQQGAKVEKAKSCPFCGSCDIRAYRWPLRINDVPIPYEYQILCYNCRANINSVNGLQDAITAWNRRKKE